MPPRELRIGMSFKDILALMFGVLWFLFDPTHRQYVWRTRVHIMVNFKRALYESILTTAHRKWIVTVGGVSSCVTPTCGRGGGGGSGGSALSKCQLFLTCLFTTVM